jgi:hypothetical protein
MPERALDGRSRNTRLTKFLREQKSMSRSQAAELLALGFSRSLHVTKPMRELYIA